MTQADPAASNADHRHRYATRLWDSFTVRMIAFAVMLALATGLLVGVLAYSRAQSALRSEAQAKLDLLARDLADGIRGELESALQIINNWSRLEVMRSILYADVDKELAQFLQRSLEVRSTFRAVVVLSQSGATVAQAGGGFEAADMNIDVKDIPVWHIGDEPAVVLRHPVAHPDRPSERIGTLVLLVSLSDLLTTNAAAGLTDNGGSAVLSDVTGKQLVATGMIDRRTDDPSLVAGREFSIQSAGGSVKLVLRAAQPGSDAFARISELRATMLNVGLFALLASAGLGALIAWRLGRPVRALTDSITRIGASGQLDPDIEIPHASGEIGALAASFKDMLEALSEAQLKNEDRERLAILGELSASVAHEIRTPMAVLKMSAQMLDDADTKPADRERLIGMISSEVGRIDGLIENLLGIARPKPLLMNRIDLARTSDRAVALVRPACRQRNVEIVVSGDDESYFAAANADSLHQVFVNLLRNALQAGNDPGTIAVRFAREQNKARITIEDQGPGFAADVLETALLPFVTTKADGSGLGLAICRRIIEEHGGELTIGNGTTGGAVITIRLPINGGTA
jgi:signal transduction histidine kinase